LKLLTLELLLFVCSFSAFAVNVEVINGANIPDYIMEEIHSIAVEAKEFKIVISSKTRSVKKQVEVMLDYYIFCNKIMDAKKECGIELARRVYDSDCHGGFSIFDPSASRDVNLKKMTDELTTSLIQLGDSRRCMNHVIIPGVFSKNIAIDIKPSSISNKQKFYQAVINNKNVVRFFYPLIKGVPKSEVKDAAFHLEFVRNKL
jgi:hypothetical protein